MNHLGEKAMKVVFLIAACASVLAVFLICVFLFANGLPAMGKIGPLKFLFGTEWRPTNDKFGILPMIVASIYVTAGAILIGVPIALFTSVFMARYCPKKIYKPLKSGIELMAGVPSIVYGYFGLVLLVPLIRQLFGGTGSSMLAACILLGIMILPTIIGPTESALRSVSESYYEGSLALGATKERSIFVVMLPAAKSGILAGVVLGIGRAIGETMAVLMVVGNAPVIPDSISSPISTLTSQIALDMSYSSGLHRSALFGMGVVLFIISAALVGIVRLISKKRG